MVPLPEESVRQMKEGYLTAVHETCLVKTPEGAAIDNDGQLTSINAESYASMNM